jgi:hypothetical protein
MQVNFYENIPANRGIVLDLDFFEGAGLLAHDLSRYHSNGVFGPGAAAPTWTQLANGRWVLTFAGAHYITVTNPAVLNITDNLTVETLCYITGAVANKYQVVNGTDGLARGYLMRATNEILWRVGNNVPPLQSIAFAATPATWYHAIGDYSSVSGQSLTVNGALVGTAGTIGLLDYTAIGNLYVGAFSPALYFMEGMMGFVRVYTKLMSAAEKQFRYEAALRKIS